VSGPAAPQSLVLDASVLTAWILRQQGRWQRVDRLLQAPPARLIAPAPALTEALFVARRHGNTAGYQQLHAAIASFGVQVEPTIEIDALWAAGKIAESEINPATWTTASGARRGPSTLSLGDGLILATAHRLKTIAVTFDEAWSHFPTMKLSSASAWNLPAA
jgi:predicted nucleic acid-binding protein